MRTILTALAAALLAACSNIAAEAPDVAPVVAAERAFAADAAEQGWVEAFLTHSAPDAIVLAAGPESAHQALAGIDAANHGDTSLTWGPDFAGMSRGGDFGFTTGPFNGGGQSFGQYFTVWRLAPDGSWKWIYDGGVGSRTPTVVNTAARVTALPVGARGAGSAEAAIEAVRRREESLAAAAAEDAGEAFAAAMAENGRLNRQDQTSAEGPQAAQALAGAGAVRYAAPEMVEAGAAGDLVFTLGEARWDGGSGYYARIWVLQRDGWKIGYDQIVPRALPSQDAAGEATSAP